MMFLRPAALMAFRCHNFSDIISLNIFSPSLRMRHPADLMDRQPAGGRPMLEVGYYGGHRDQNDPDRGYNHSLANKGPI